MAFPCPIQIQLTRTAFVKSKLVFKDRGITETSNNDRWRNHRRLAPTWLNPRAVDNYCEVLDCKAATLLKELYAGRNAPINPQPHAGRCSLNNMLTIVFGIRTESTDDPLVKTALRISREFMNCTGPMSNLTDFVNPLQWFTNPFTARAKHLHEDWWPTTAG